MGCPDGRLGRQEAFTASNCSEALTANFVVVLFLKITHFFTFSHREPEIRGSPSNLVNLHAYI